MLIPIIIHAVKECKPSAIYWKKWIPFNQLIANYFVNYGLKFVGPFFFYFFTKNPLHSILIQSKKLGKIKLGQMSGKNGEIGELRALI